MEDTASNSVKIVGEVVPESTESSIGLTLTDVPTVGSAHGVTGPRTTEARIQSGADVEAITNAHTGESVSNPGANGSQVTVEIPRQSRVTAKSMRRSHSHSPLGRALSPRPSQSAELRARFARLGQARKVRYVPVPSNVPIPPVPKDTVMRGEADAALAQLQKQISVATQRTEALVTQVEDTRKTAMAAGQVATEGTSGVARTNAGLDAMVVELRNELQAMRE